MASVGGPDFHINYSIQTGQVRSFELNGKILFDRDNEIIHENWKQLLVNTVLDNDLHIDDGYGCMAFVYWLSEQGLVTIKDDND